MSLNFSITRLVRRWRLKRRSASIATSPLFDAGWYRKRYPDVHTASVDPAVHYIAAGAAEGRQPHPLFDPDWYLKQTNHPELSDQTPLEHYLSRPASKRCSPHPMFDSDWYRNNNPDVAEADVDALGHFIESGGRQGRSPHRDFDGAWYLSRYPDVAVAGVNPLVHYLEIGASEGRDPNPDFSTEAYLERYPDVAGAGLNPLVHFIKTGRREGRVAESVIRDQGPLDSDRDICLASGLFDPEWYKAAYSDIAEAGIDPLGHYLATGVAEGRNPSPWFDTNWYVTSYPEAAKSGMNPLVHYQQSGREIGYKPQPGAKSRLWWEEPTNRYDSRARNDQGALDALQRAVQPPGTCVVIPIFNAPDELDACLESVLRHTPAGVSIIAIDDASTDVRVGQVLDKHAGDQRVDRLANRENIGYTATINRGIAHAGARDVVLLNSDTVVGPGWLARLRLCAYSEVNIGTATALSNNAGAFSAPRTNRENPLPEGIPFEPFSRAVAQASGRLYPGTPTGNGFCMYIRRDCLDEVGPFDDQAFAHGYGEENDFCMRGRAKGWKHVIDDATYVFHHRSASFGERRAKLVERGSEVITERYPAYSGLVAEFLRSKPLELACRLVERVGQAVAGRTSAVKPRVLFVIAALHDDGGTALTNLDLMDALEPDLETFLLRSDGKLVELFSYRAGEFVLLDYAVLAEPVRAFPHTSTEYDSVVSQWLRDYAIERIHIRHIALHGLGLVDIARQMWLPVVFSFHDYYTICPTVKLLDENLRFCAGRCTATRGHCTPELWPDEEMPELKHAAVGDWKKMFAPVLENCDALVTTCESARELVCSNFPALRESAFHVIPHGRDFPEFLPPPAGPGDNEALRVLFPGNLTRAKGGDAIAALAGNAAECGLEIHVVGRWLAGEPPPGVVVHGPYARAEFTRRVRELRPHIGGVLSIWPETWCHTLTELWAAGLPVVGVDLGAVGERIQATGAGWPVAERETGALVELFRRIRQNPDDYAQKTARVRAWQEAEGRDQDCAAMAQRYRAVYASLAPAGQA